MKNSKSKFTNLNFLKIILLIGGIIILLLQIIATLLIDKDLQIFVINRFYHNSILNLYSNRLHNTPLFYPYRILWLVIIFIAAAPLLYIFFFIIYRSRKNNLMKIFSRIFIILLIIDLLKAIWIVWFFKGHPLIYMIWGLDERTAFFPSRFLHLAFWIAFVRINAKFSEFKSITKKILFQFQFWIALFWLLIHLWVISNPDYFYYGYDPTPYFLFSFFSLLICQIIAIAQAFIMIGEKEIKASTIVD